jgi:hypothetical protein
MPDLRRLAVLALTTAAAALPAAPAHAAWHADRGFANGRFTLRDPFTWGRPAGAIAAPGGGTLVTTIGGLQGITPGGRVDQHHIGIVLQGTTGVHEPVAWGATTLTYGRVLPNDPLDDLAPESVDLRDEGGSALPGGAALTAALAEARRAWLAPLSDTRLLALQDGVAAGFILRTLDVTGADLQGRQVVRWPRGVPAQPAIATQPAVSGGAAYVAATSASGRGAAWVVRLRPGAGADARFGAVRLPSAPDQLLPWTARGGVIAVERTHVTWIDRTGRVVRRLALRSLAAAVDAHGRVVVVSQAGLFRDVRVMRLRADGQPDRAFGFVSLSMSGAERAVPEAVVIQRDGRIVVVGSWGTTVPNHQGAADDRFAWISRLGTVAWRVAP